jgi:hypothetical protein
LQNGKYFNKYIDCGGQDNDFRTFQKKVRKEYVA